jgi:hypothetical protein
MPDYTASISGDVIFINGVTFFIMAQQPLVRHASSLLKFRDHTQTHRNLLDSSGRVIGPSQVPLPDNTKQPQETDIHVPGGVRIRNPST